MFKQFKTGVQQQFAEISKGNLFYVTIDRDKIFEVYLNGFADPEKRQGNNCNCCKSFLRQWGGIVAIDENLKMTSIWDFENPSEEYEQARKNLSGYIHSLPITDVFLNPFKNCGTDGNFDMVSNVTWEHFFITLPPKFVTSDVDSKLGERRETRNMLKRNFEELTIDATETVLELVAQNSLYRGIEFEALLKKLLLAQESYKDVPLEHKENYIWLQSLLLPVSVSRIRNSAIGTLLINFSEGMDIEIAVSKYEKVMAPTNYKRPTALVTTKQTENAKEKLKSMGLLESLNRRYATEADLNVNDILFTDKTIENLDVFGEMAKEQLVNPRTFEKTEEISIQDFITNVVPTSKTIELLVETPHLNNLVSIVTAEIPGTPSLFKWNNTFSWAYTGGITDSMKERVKAAGGKIDGVLRGSIQWNEDKYSDSRIDLDIHCFEPNSNRIYYGNYRRPMKSAMSGQLDVDIQTPGSSVAVENIVWDQISKMKDGEYRFEIHNYSNATCLKGFSAQIEFNKEVFDFSYAKPIRGRDVVQIAVVKLEKGVFSIISSMPINSLINSKEKWNVKSNQFHKIDKMMLSPNYWGSTPKGNKHYFFLLKGCKADETPRPFFNEFLKDEFTEDRKVFEIVGAKLKIAPSERQLSGIGFSETQHEHIIVRVEGKFKRTLKVNI